MPSRRGFTLIELMIVVSIIGILSAIAIPKFAELIRKSNEGATKGNLAALRSALTIYYGDMEGQFPYATGWNLTTTSLNSLVPKYIGAIPKARAPKYHGDSTLVRYHGIPSTHNHDYGYWYYDGTWTGSTNNASCTGGVCSWGQIWVACFHTDSKGTYWSTY